MPKLQLIRDFFCELEGPYTVIKLTSSAAKERIERLELLACGDRFGYFSALMEYFIESAKVLECRRYRTDVARANFQCNTGIFAIAHEGCLGGLQPGV